MDNTIHHHLSSESATSSFRNVLIIIREEALKQQLAIYLKNLNRLEIRKAQYGIDVPIHLLNEIEYTREQICRLVEELRRKEGILSELETLPQSESIEWRDSDSPNLGHGLYTT